MRDLDDLLKEDVQEAQKLDVEAAFRRVQARTRRPARLKELPTRIRLGLAGLGFSGTGLALVTSQGLRPDLSEDIWTALVPLCGILLLAGYAAALVPLRPLDRSGARGVMPLAGLVLATSMALTGLFPGIADLAIPSLPVHLGCLAATTLGTASILCVFLALDRAPRPHPWRVGSAAAGGALIAFAAQQLVCPWTDPVHLCLTHGAAGWLLGIPTVAAAAILIRWKGLSGH